MTSKVSKSCNEWLIENPVSSIFHLIYKEIKENKENIYESFLNWINSVPVHAPGDIFHVVLTSQLSNLSYSNLLTSFLTIQLIYSWSSGSYYIVSHLGSQTIEENEKKLWDGNIHYNYIRAFFILILVVVVLERAPQILFRYSVSLDTRTRLDSQSISPSVRRVINDELLSCISPCHGCCSSWFLHWNQFLHHIIILCNSNAIHWVQPRSLSKSNQDKGITYSNLAINNTQRVLR